MLETNQPPLVERPNACFLGNKQKATGSKQYRCISKYKWGASSRALGIWMCLQGWTNVFSTAYEVWGMNWCIREPIRAVWHPQNRSQMSKNTSASYFPWFSNMFKCIFVDCMIFWNYLYWSVSIHICTLLIVCFMSSISLFTGSIAAKIKYDFRLLGDLGL